jgi:hypothetical protein
MPGGLIAIGLFLAAQSAQSQGPVVAPCWTRGEATETIEATYGPPREADLVDLDYKGDSRKWLEVSGKAEVVKGIVYLKALMVLPSKGPDKERDDPPR